MNYYKVTFNYGGDLGNEYRYYCANSLTALVSHLKAREQYIKAINLIKKEPEIYTTI